MLKVTDIDVDMIKSKGQHLGTHTDGLELRVRRELAMDTMTEKLWIKRLELVLMIIKVHFILLRTCSPKFRNGVSIAPIMHDYVTKRHQKFFCKTQR